MALDERTAREGGVAGRGSMDPHQASGLEPPFHFSKRGIGPFSQNEFPMSVKYVPTISPGAVLSRVL